MATQAQQPHPAHLAEALVSGARSEQADSAEIASDTRAATSVAGSRARRPGPAVPDGAVDAILERLACGETLTAICRDVGIARLTWYRWIDADAALRAKYERAIQIGTDVLGDLAHDIAGGTRVIEDQVAVGATKLQLDAIKWVAAVRHPARYSERHTAHIAGQMAQDTAPALPVRVDLAALTIDDLRALESINERALRPAEDTEEDGDGDTGG